MEIRGELTTASNVYVNYISLGFLLGDPLNHQSSTNLYLQHRSNDSSDTQKDTQFSVMSNFLMVCNNQSSGRFFA